MEALPRPASRTISVTDGKAEYRERVLALQQERMRKTVERATTFREQTHERLEQLTASRRERASKIAEQNQLRRERYLEGQRRRDEARAQVRAATPERLSELGAMVGVGLGSYLARRITDCPIVEEFAMAWGGEYGAAFGRRLVGPRGD